MRFDTAALLQLGPLDPENAVRMENKGINSELTLTYLEIISVGMFVHAKVHANKNNHKTTWKTNYDSLTIRKLVKAYKLVRSAEYRSGSQTGNNVNDKKDKKDENKI